MAKLIPSPNKALHEALGHLVMAELLIGGVAAQEPDTYEMSDSLSLLQDAITQLKGEMRNRADAERAA